MSQMGAFEVPQVPPVSLPHYVDSGSEGILSNSYNSLGHSLRANIFPGSPFAWKSVSSESYVTYAHTAWPPELWFGHKTDEMVQWTEKNIMNHKLNKTLTEVGKKSSIKM